MIFRLLNIQGIAGVAVSLALGILLLVQKAETTHWKKQSASFEQLYHDGQAAFAETVANYRSAAAQARAADSANAARIAAEQGAINQRIINDYQARIVAARASAQRLRDSSQPTADPGAGGKPRLSGLSTAPRRAAQAAGQDQLSRSDRLTATEQAIQLDELITWVRQQAKVDNNPRL